MQEIDRLFFNKYALDPGSDMLNSNSMKDEYICVEDYDDFYTNGLDDEGWPELE